jgi:hypothetical protein
MPAPYGDMRCNMTQELHVRSTSRQTESGYILYGSLWVALVDEGNTRPHAHFARTPLADVDYALIDTGKPLILRTMIIIHFIDNGRPVKLTRGPVHGCWHGTQ